MALDGDRNHVIHVSGGRTSGLMLRMALDALGGTLPPSVRAVFCNTGKEREETLVFIAEMSTRWSVPIIWLEYVRRPSAAGGIRDPRNTYRKTNFTQAKRRGEPFEAVIRFKNVLPSYHMRYCTTELKVRTTERWARRELGWHRRHAPLDYIGIRADEEARFKRIIFGSKACRVRLPMVDAGVTEAYVLDWWAQQPFDLGLPPGQSNCDLCFLKGKAQITRTLTAEPERAAWWIRQEDWRKTRALRCRDPKIEQFLDEATYREMVEDARAPSERNTAQNARENRQGKVGCFCGD